MTTQANPFRPWQWAEIGALLVLIFAQVALNLTGHLVASFLVGLPTLALLVHAYTWMLPLFREQRRRRHGR